MRFESTKLWPLSKSVALDNIGVDQDPKKLSGKKNKKTDGQLMHESDRFNLLPVDNTKRFVSTKKPSLNKKYLKVKCVMKCGIISHSVTKRIWS